MKESGTGTKAGSACACACRRNPSAANRIVTLRANTFSMNALQISSDVRPLGVRVFALSIGRPDSQAWATTDCVRRARAPRKGPRRRAVRLASGSGRRSGQARKGAKAIQ